MEFLKKDLEGVLDARNAASAIICFSSVILGSLITQSFLAGIILAVFTTMAVWCGMSGNVKRFKRSL